MSTDTSSEAFLEKLYRQNADPWAFSSSAHETARYETIIKSLSDRRYARACEPGCSIGALTHRLAAICDHVVAFDISPTVVAIARQTCSHLDNVTISQGTLPKELPVGRFDLIVFSDIGYYFETTRLQSMAQAMVHRVHHGGTFLAAHWLEVSRDHRLTGDEVHECLDTVQKIHPVRRERHAGFRLDRVK